MEKNKTDWRMWIGIILILAGVFYKPGMFPALKPKIAEPEAEVVELVKDISISDPADSSKLAGMFYAMSESLEETNLPTNLKVQYFVSHVGKGVFGQELLKDGKPKYPKFSPAVAKSMTKILGSQTDTSPITADKKRKLARLFYGLSWKLYKKEFDSLFETYKVSVGTIIREYNKVPDQPKPDDIDSCPCAATGFIIHGDGHKTPCPCIANGKQCKHKCKSTGKPPKTKPKKEQPKQQPPTPKPKCECDTDTTYCICITEFGQCSCNDRGSAENIYYERRTFLDWLLGR